MNFAAATFDKENFNNIACLQEDLRNKEFSDCVFKKCDFSGSDFSGSSFMDCTFLDCNLSNIKVNGCRFQGVNFTNCKLLGIIFALINTFLIKWSFQKCIVALCDFSDLNIKDSKFLHCELRENDFVNTNLAKCDFFESDFAASKFQNANLEEANLVGAKNYYIDPKQNRLKQARFSYPEVLSLLDTFGIKIEY